MRRVGHLVVALSRSWLRNRDAVFFALLFPIILLVIFSTVFAGGTAEFTVFVQNNDLTTDGDPTDLSATFVESLASVDVLSVRSIPADRNLTAWNQHDRTSDTKRVVVIPDGFAAQVRNQSMRVRMAVLSDTIDRTSDQMNASQTTRVRQNLERARAETNASGPVELTFLAPPDDESAPAVRGILTSVVARFNERAIGAEESTVTVRTDSLGGAGLSAADYYLPALIAAIVVINGVMTVPAVIAGFNADGTLKRLVATPLGKRDWILANVLQQALLALVLMGVMVLVAHLLFGVQAVPGPLSIALVLLGAVAFSGLGMALGSQLPDPDAATSLGGAIAFPLLFLSGVFWEVDVMPASLQVVAEFMPLYYFHRGLRRLMILETTEGVFLPFAIMGAMAVAFVTLAIAATSWENVGE